MAPTSGVAREVRRALPSAWATGASRAPLPGVPPVLAAKCGFCGADPRRAG
jgi:hypothetical protein